MDRRRSVNMNETGSINTNINMKMNMHININMLITTPVITNIKT